MTTAPRRRPTGVALALTGAASFGVAPVLTEVAYGDGAEPVGVLAVRFAIAAAALAALLIGPSDTAVLSAVEPVAGIAVAGLGSGERLGPLKLAGGVAVLAAVAARARPGTPAVAPEAVPA